MRFARWVSRLTAVLVGAGVVLVALGFLGFLWRLPAEEAGFNRKADGIVVLTGGAERVTDAIELLAAGSGQRLLISGVHPATRPEEISKLNPDYERIVRCCVDLDRAARNTLGNAQGTRRWVKERGFGSLIVVTSSYHMPRAMIELEHQLPTVTLIPFPVVTEKLRTEPWWSSGATMKLVFTEYLKYVAAWVRIRFEPPGEGNDAVRPS
jgi:uncharacterized SAM-binding protein YcdF (DUF218 family)